MWTDQRPAELNHGLSSIFVNFLIHLYPSFTIFIHLNIYPIPFPPSHLLIGAHPWSLSLRALSSSFLETFSSPIIPKSILKLHPLLVNPSHFFIIFLFFLGLQVFKILSSYFFSSDYHHFLPVLHHQRPCTKVCSPFRRQTLKGIISVNEKFRTQIRSTEWGCY